MKRNADFRNALGQPDEYFQQTVINTLDELNRKAETEKRPARHFTFRTVCAFAAMLVIAFGVVLSVRTNAWETLTASSVDSIKPTPEIITPAEDPRVVETEYTTLTIREAVADDNGVYMTVEVKPKRENCLALNAIICPDGIPPIAIGRKQDSEEQSLQAWAKGHGYELLSVQLSLPSVTAFVCDNCGFRVREDGSIVISLSGKALPDTDLYDLNWTICPWDMSMETRSRLLDSQAESGSIPVRVSAEKAAEKTVETDRVTITFHDAVSDGFGVFIPTKVRAKNEKTLLMPPSFDPYWSTPEDIGKTPDTPGQNIYQWAEAHGYEEILQIYFASPYGSPTSDANLNSYNYAFTLQEDNSLTGTSGGCTLPQADLYEVYWNVTPYDLTQATRDFIDNTATIPMIYEEDEDGVAVIAVANEPETMEPVTGVYHPVDDPGTIWTGPATSVVLYRTSRCDYVQMQTTDERFVNFDSFFLYSDDTDITSSRIMKVPYIYKTAQNEDGTMTMITTSWVIPDKLPDTLTMELYQRDASAGYIFTRVELKNKP